MKGICLSFTPGESGPIFQSRRSSAVCVAEEEAAEDDDETLQKIEGPQRMCPVSRRSVFGLGKHNPVEVEKWFLSVSSDFTDLHPVTHPSTLQNLRKH